MNNKLIAALVVSGLMSASAVAVAEPGTWYIVPGIGAVGTNSKLKADDGGPSYSLRLGKEISDHWDVQAGISYVDLDKDNAALSAGKYKQTLFGVDALYFFNRDSKFRPFLLAGLGGAQNNISYTQQGTGIRVGKRNTSWMGNLGIGFQYLFTDRVGLQADVRQVWSDAKDDSRVLFSGKETVDNTYLNLGLVFRFGGAEKPLEPTPEPVAIPEPAPAPVAVEPPPPPPPPPAPEPVFEKVTLQAELLFGFDKQKLSAAGEKLLDAEVADKMLAHPEIQAVVITGHTDRIGSDQYNQKLSERRAEAVRDYLVRRGIDMSRLQAVGKGEKEPIESCKGVRGSKKLIDCLAPNRRVIIEIAH